MKNDTCHKKITPSKQNYLKVLLKLSDDGDIHSSDVADALGITKASVSCMMNILKDEGYITKEKYGTVALTEKGRYEAENVKKRYDLLKEFLNKTLGLDADTAAEDACRIEHIISAECMDKIDEKLTSL